MADIVKELRKPWTVVSICQEKMQQAADEIERLRAIIRVNGLRAGATHAEIDAMLGIAPKEDENDA